MDHAPLDWEGIRHAYVFGDWSLRRIADAFGTSSKTLTKRAQAGGWIREVGTKPLPRGRKPRPPGVPGAPRPNVREARARRIVSGLYAALDEKMRQIEERMAKAQEAGAEAPSAADAERDARTLSGLARLYAKLVELDDGAQSAGGREQDQATAALEATDNADRLRRDLALRLQRLNQARGP